MGNINDYGFPFTSSNGDRAYTAADFRAFYELLFTTGLAYGALNSLEVVQQDTPDMSVLVKSGAVMIRGAMRVVETAETLEPNTNPAGSDRIDYVVARLVYATRRIDLALVQGVAGAGAPALTRNASVYELALASLTLTPAFASVTTAMITDTREDAALCGYLGFQTLRGSALVLDTVDTGQGANKLYPMDQDVRQAASPTFAALDTGHGVNQLYPMDQDVRQAASPAFTDATIASKLLSTYLAYLNQDLKNTASPTFVDVNARINGAQFYAGGAKRSIEMSGSVDGDWYTDILPYIPLPGNKINAHGWLANAAGERLLVTYFARGGANITAWGLNLDGGLNYFYLFPGGTAAMTGRISL